MLSSWFGLEPIPICSVDLAPFSGCRRTGGGAERPLSAVGSPLGASLSPDPARATPLPRPRKCVRRPPTRSFPSGCEAQDVELARITPGIAAGFIGGLAPATANQRLAMAALRRFFDLLVTRHAVLLNPFQSVRGPPRSTHDGETPEITPDQARSPPGLPRPVPARRCPRPGALRHPGLHRRPRRRRHQPPAPGPPRPGRLPHPLVSARSAGREREIPVRYDLDEWLAAYLAAAGVDGDPGDAPFFRPLTTGRNAFEPRPLQPWTIRAILVDLGFLRVGEKGSREYAYVLILHPHKVVRSLHDAGSVPSSWWSLFHARLRDIGAPLPEPMP